MESMSLEASENYFLFWVQAAKYHDLVQALLKEGQNKTHKNFNSQKRHDFEVSLKTCTLLPSKIWIVQFWFVLSMCVFHVAYREDSENNTSFI